MQILHDLVCKLLGWRSLGTYYSILLVYIYIFFFFTYILMLFQQKNKRPSVVLNALLTVHDCYST